MHRIRQAAALFLCAGLLALTACGKPQTTASTTATAEETAAAQAVQYTASPATLRKAETVYVNLDNSGKRQSVSVTDWLHTDVGEVAAPDKSDLKNIQDIKGGVVPRRDGEKLLWDMPSTDLYYRGTSDKALPVEFDLTYTLNGKTVSPDKIAGKSGDVQIRVQMTNTCTENGVYLPVVAAGLLILPEGVFSGVQVENGLVIGDGAKQIVVGLGLPGMAESLHLQDTARLGDIAIRDSFTVTAKADSFSLDNLYFAVLPLCSMDLGAVFPGDEAQAQAQAFFAKLQRIFDAFSGLDADVLLDALTGKNLTSLGTVLQDAVDMYERNTALLDVLTKYMTKENLTHISDLLTALQDPETAQMLEKLDNPLLKRSLTGLPEILESIEALTPVLTALQEDMQDPKVQAALDSLPQTLQTLNELRTVLEDNRALLTAAGELADSDALAALTALAQEKDTRQLLEGLTQDAEAMLPHLQSYLDFGKRYGLFTDAPEQAEISLLFIYMTPSLHAAKTAETATVQSAENTPWYKKVLG